MGNSADWNGLEVTGEDNPVDGWWTSGRLTEQSTGPATDFHVP